MLKDIQGPGLRLRAAPKQIWRITPQKPVSRLQPRLNDDRSFIFVYFPMITNGNMYMLWIRKCKN